MQRSRWRKVATSAGVFCLLAAASFVLVRCGGSSTMAGVGSANVTISDPPSCTDQFSHVYVTITGVMAHTSASAAPGAAGWQNLTTQLSLNSPVQLDLLNLSGGGTVECLLKQLGSDQSLPVGSYQQLRLMLADNGGSATMSGNNCVTYNNVATGLPSGTMDCVEDSSGNWYPLELSSQDITGLKIPPGQILGGPINVAAGKTVDLNINFNTCSSLVPDPAHSAYRLNPTLTASQVAPNTSGISGTVYTATSSGSTNPTVSPVKALGGATVNLELPNAGPMDTQNSYSTDGIYDTAITDSSGNFYFCPLDTQTGGIDVVADAPAPTTGTPPSTAGATIIEGVPNGAKLAAVPIVVQGGSTSMNSPGKLQVTPSVTQASGSAFTVNLDLFPLQLTTGSSPNPYEFIVPALNGSAGTSMTVSCPGGTGVNCTVSSPGSGSASIVVPANPPLVGSYNTSGGTINWSSGPVFGSSASSGNYVVEVDGSVGNNPSHTCTTTFSTPPSKVTAGTTTSVSINVSGCQ